MTEDKYLVTEDDMIGNHPYSTKTIEKDLQMRLPPTFKNKSHFTHDGPKD